MPDITTPFHPFDPAYDRLVDLTPFVHSERITMPTFRHADAAYLGFKSTDPIDELREERDLIERRIAELERIGRDDYDDGALLVFERTFEARGRQVFTYAALKAGGAWYLTGRTSHGVTWDLLVTDHLSKATGVWYVAELLPVE